MTMDNKEISDSDEIRRRIADAKEKLDRIKYLSEKTEELVALSEESTKLLPEIKRERELANTEFLEFKNEINTFVNDQKVSAEVIERRVSDSNSRLQSLENALQKTESDFSQMIATLENELSSNKRSINYVLGIIFIAVIASVVAIVLSLGLD